MSDETACFLAGFALATVWILGLLQLTGGI